MRLAFSVIVKKDKKNKLHFYAMDESLNEISVFIVVPAAVDSIPPYA